MERDSPLLRSLARGLPLGSRRLPGRRARERQEAPQLPLPQHRLARKGRSVTASSPAAPFGSRGRLPGRRAGERQEAPQRRLARKPLPQRRLALAGCLSRSAAASQRRRKRQWPVAGYAAAAVRLRVRRACAWAAAAAAKSFPRMGVWPCGLKWALGFIWMEKSNGPINKKND